jgi:predicted enzyme related to lactoylglutathione lyase
MDLLVNVDVDDLERAVSFYTAGLDLRIGRRLGADVVEMVGASAPIYLLRKAAGTLAAMGSAQVRYYARHWTPVHLDFVVPDIGAAVERALKAGATLEQSPQASRWGKLALLADPFGHGFCFVEFIGRGYDEGL